VEANEEGEIILIFVWIFTYMYKHFTVLLIFETGSVFAQPEDY